MQRATETSTCTVCSRGFEVRFRYQVREEAGEFMYFCSQRCQQASLESDRACRCDSCGNEFALEFPWQATTSDGDAAHHCSEACAAAWKARSVDRPASVPRRIAVFNHKGGTGKTTTAVNLAAGLAESGLRVLLVDADGQGNVGASLGIRGEHGLYHVLLSGMSVADAAVPVRPGFDVLTSNETLAAAELALATRPNRHRVMRERLGDRAAGYDMVVIDCAPALSLMNQNALVYADGILVPVSCDYLSLVGVKQVTRTVRNVRELLKHDIKLVGVVPTFFDVRNKICREAAEALGEHFGELCLPPIRVNTKLREAPSVRKTIFEHAPDSHGAEDYRTLVARVLRGPGPQAATRPQAATQLADVGDELEIPIELDLEVEPVPVAALASGGA